MRPIEKIELITKIALKLQDKFTFDLIDAYLPSFGIECPNFDIDRNSKRVYVQKLLSNVKDEVIEKIADDLEIEYVKANVVSVMPTFWKQGYFKIFISHVALFKDKAVELQNAMLKYGITSFVAHIDIEPSKEWLDEIEKALHTMDAFVAILMDGFSSSKWCDQEVGFAVAKDVLIIPIKKDIDPYGFIGKYQAIKADGKKSVEDIAKEVFTTIVRNGKTSNLLLLNLSNIIASSMDEKIALKQMDILLEVEKIPNEVLTQMSEQLKNNEILKKSTTFIAKAKKLFDKYGLKIDLSKTQASDFYDEEIPF